MSYCAMIVILTGGKHMYSTYPEHIHMVPGGCSFRQNSILNSKLRIFLKFSKRKIAIRKLGWGKKDFFPTYQSLNFCRKNELGRKSFYELKIIHLA